MVDFAVIPRQKQRENRVDFLLQVVAEKVHHPSYDRTVVGEFRLLASLDPNPCEANELDVCADLLVAQMRRVNEEVFRVKLEGRRFLHDSLQECLAPLPSGPKE